MTTPIRTTPPTTRTDMMQTIIYQNNMTVAFLEQQDFDNAIQSSGLALRSHQLLQSNAAHERMPGPSHETSLDFLDRCMLLAGSRIEKGMLSAKDDDNDDESPFVYSHGILLPTNININCTSTCLSAVLIFNSALSYHLFAQECLQQGSFSQKEHLIRALRLYELAYGVNTSGQFNVLFQFVVINNIAVVKQATGEKKVSQTYFHNLLTVLMVLVDQENLPKLRQLQGFLRNLPSKCNRDIATAA